MKSPSHHAPLGAWELAALLHAGVLLAAITWMFGGNDLAIRPWLGAWASLSAPLALAALASPRARAEAGGRRLAWLGPIVLFNALVLVSNLTPGLRELRLTSGDFYAARDVAAWRPSSALPADARRGLWLFDALYLSCFNLAWLVRQRRALRGLMLFACGNALALAVFGTAQKLSGATGIFFGLAPSPNPAFFASFIYDNHWGAFTVLMLAACLGLAWHYGLRKRNRRDFFHSPVLAGLLAVLLLAATAPLSTSRSCTVLALLLLGGAFLHWLGRLGRQRREYKESVAAPLAGALLAVALGLGGVWFLAGPTIRLRLAKTHEQLLEVRERGATFGRPILYRDTWRMARDRLWFGWGMDSYPIVFQFYNTETPGPIDHLPVNFHDAHSDWLQSAAEHGLVGTALLGLCGLVPLAGIRARPPRSPLPVYLFAGCGLVLLYAWLEFPFGNLAVVFTWWMCFFTAVRYTELQRPRDPVPDPGSGKDRGVERVVPNAPARSGG